MYGAKLKYLIKNKGLSQGEMAKKIDVSKSTISFWIKAEYPPLEGINKILKYFNMSLAEFFLDSKTIEKSLGISIEYIELAKSIDQLPLKKKKEMIKFIHAALDLAEVFGSE